jgi:hypothetical protein
MAHGPAEGLLIPGRAETPDRRLVLVATPAHGQGEMGDWTPPGEEGRERVGPLDRRLGGRHVSPVDP